jgi:hypothetical protein
MATYSAMQGLKNALLAAATTLFTGQDVSIGRGYPARDALPDVISLGVGTSELEPATITSSRRTREEMLTLEVIISAFRGGGPEQEDIVDARADAMLGLLAEYVRVTDNTLGGAVREIFLTSYATADATDQAVLSKGRMQVITATFTAHARITS